MSTQPRSTKVAAKRRAVGRKRRREMLRRAAAIFFVAIFVLGTITTALVFQQGSSTASPAGSTNVPAATVPPAGAQSGSTPQTAQQLVQQLVTQGDQAATKGDYKSAISFYKSALGLGQDNATIRYNLGKAYIQQQQYSEGVTNLQQALTLNPSASFASEANSLISTYKGKPDVATAVTTPGSATGGGTSPITSTGTITK